MNRGHNKERILHVLANCKKKTKAKSCVLVIGDENLMMSETYMFRWVVNSCIIRNRSYLGEGAG